MVKKKEIKYRVVGHTPDGEEIVERASPVRFNEALDVLETVQALGAAFLENKLTVLEALEAQAETATEADLAVEDGFYERMAAGLKARFRMTL